MVILFYKTQTNSDIENQRIGKPNYWFQNLDANNKEDAKKIFRSLIAQFGNPYIAVNGNDIENDNFRVYNLEDSCSMGEFVNDFNENVEEIINADNAYSMILNLDMKDVEELIKWKSIDYVIVDKETKKPKTYGDFNEIVDVREYFESADSDITSTANETIYCLISYPKSMNNGSITEYDVYVINIETYSVNEIDCFVAREKEWNDDVKTHLFEAADGVYVYALKTEFMNGYHYSSSQTESIYKSYDKAKDVLDYLANSVAADFEKHYRKKDIKAERFFGVNTIYKIDAANEEEGDSWNGSIIRMELKD